MKSKLNNWHDIPWSLYYREVSKIQEDLVMAYRADNLHRVYQLQRKLVVSLAARSLAIRRVMTNSGSSTPGVDKQLWDSPAKRMDALLQLREITHNPQSYRASPLKRVWIPKENSDEMRPLGIPTLIDRAVQAVYQMAVDPIVEEQSDPNSYGFRLNRSTHDAITRIRTLLDKTTSPQWILDADVAKCFDTISHEFLLKQTIMCDRTVLEQWLKSGVQNAGSASTEQTTQGTPQGGIISPMLCNVALNGLESVAIKAAESIRVGGRTKVHLTRYADDFVCTGVSQEILEECVKPAIASFLWERGLEFKDSKTQIVNVTQGFDFLGFRFQAKPWNYKLNQSRKNGPTRATVLIVKPRDQKVMALKDSIRAVIKPTRPIASIIRDLNPILRGWSEYYRISYHSLPVFWSLGHYVWYKMWKWARDRHPKRNAQWIYDKYVMAGGDRKWVFGNTIRESLFDISKVTNWRIFPLKQGLNPYVLLNQEYYEKRKQVRIEAKFRAAIYRKFKHTCPHCGQSLHNGESVELHHLIAIKDGGKWSMDNIHPLHTICHQSVTYSRLYKQKPAEEKLEL